MDKVICDICGTSYPASATQCPICGCEKSADPVLDEEIAAAGEAAAYKPVRGGRFSNANVRKRNKMAAVPAQKAYEPEEDEDEDDDEELEEEERSNKGLVVVLVLLILAILALVLYLYFNFFAPVSDDTKDTELVSTTTAAATESVETEAPTVPCTDLEVSDTEIVLDAIGNAWLLNVVAAPADTTDSISYASSDESVATVTDEGCITAVGPGTVVVTVTCGDVVVECNVTCTIETEPATEAPTEPAEETTAATEPAGEWKLNRQDITMRVGEVWPLYEGDVSTALITFSANDTSVATFKKGDVTAVGEGYTVVTAEYNGVKYECIIRVKPAITETQPPETTAPPANDSGDAVG